MAFAQERTYTIDDIYALPDGQRAELIDGQMYMMAPPNTMHQRISYAFARKVSEYIDRKKGNRIAELEATTPATIIELPTPPAPNTWRNIFGTPPQAAAYSS